MPMLATAEIKCLWERASKCYNSNTYCFVGRPVGMYSCVLIATEHRWCVGDVITRQNSPCVAGYIGKIGVTEGAR